MGCHAIRINQPFFKNCFAAGIYLDPPSVSVIWEVLPEGTETESDDWPSGWG